MVQSLSIPLPEILLSGRAQATIVSLLRRIAPRRHLGHDSNGFREDARCFD
jgi:hypothetical protein